VADRPEAIDKSCPLDATVLPLVRERTTEVEITDELEER